MLQKLLALELKQFSQSPVSPQQQQQKPQQISKQFASINVVSFFAKCYSKITCEQIVALLTTEVVDQSVNTNIISRTRFVLRLAAQSPTLLIVLLEQVLDSKSPYHTALTLSLKSLVENETSDQHRVELFGCLNQINNSIGVFEIIINILDELGLRHRSAKSYFKKICQYSVS